MGKQSREKLARRSLGEGGVEKGRFESKTGVEKTGLFIITGATYLVLFTPLIIGTQFFFPFVAPKTIFFRILVEIMSVAYLFLVMANRAYRPRINVLTIAVTLFLAIFILTSFTGVNLGRSFWSTNERMTGILTMLHLFAFFLVLSNTFKNKKDWERIFGVSVIVGVFLGIFILTGREVSTRGGGTIGNTSFMAAYLLFNVFFAIILFLANFLKKNNWSIFWQIFAGISLLIMTPVLLNSTGRGAIAAFLGGLFLLGLGYLAFSQKKALQKTALAIVLGLIVLGVLAAVFQPPFVKDEVSSTLSEMKSRFVVWEKGWKGFLERPIFGWGPENFIVVFGKYFNPCMFLPECGNEIWFDRVHNIVLDTLVATGIVGFLSYLSVFGIAIGSLLRFIPKIAEKNNIFFPLGLAVLLVVYFFQNLLVFDMINTYLVFFLSLGFVCFLAQGQTEAKETRGRINPVLAPVIIAAALFICWTTNIQPLQANAYVIKMVGSQDVNEASSFFQKSLTGWMEKYEPREQFVQKMYKTGYQSIPEENKEFFQKAFDLAKVEMEKSVKQNYLDFRPHLFLGELYVSSYRFSGKEEEIIRAEQILEKAIQLSPTNQQGYWNLAEAKLARGKIAETISLLKKAVALEPRLGYSHWYLAMVYKIAGQNQLAKDEVVAAKNSGFSWTGDLENLKKVIEIYSALNDDENLVSLYLNAVTLEPNDAGFWAGLAASYANLGQFDKAREAARKTIEINPDLAPKVAEFLKALPK